MTTIILSIGDELILGQTVDTNSAWLAQQCAAIGVKPLQHVTVSDDQQSIEQAIRTAAPQCNILLITGGLGPTEDDLTRNALAAVLNQPLELNATALENVERFFKALKRPMPERNKIQAMLPKGTSMIENTNGTAPGIHASLATGNSQLATQIFIMPGVPKEMKLMFTRSILPQLRQHSSTGIILSKALHTFGPGESVIAQHLAKFNLMDRTRNPSVGTTVSQGVVSLRLNAYFDTTERAQQELAQTENLCRQALGDLIYGHDEDTLPTVIAEMLTDIANGFSTDPVIDLKTKTMWIATRPATVTTAESCTGGLLAKMLTDIPGSSAFFKHGWVTYSNNAKEVFLGVPTGLIDQFGAVSEAVVKMMATGARARASADFAIAISGIAGPDGATEAKPIGTVCIALAHEKDVLTKTFLFPGDREMIRDRSAKMALTMLRYHLLQKPFPF